MQMKTRLVFVLLGRAGELRGGEGETFISPSDI